MRYELYLNSVRLCDRGIESGSLSLKLGGPDTLSFFIAQSSEVSPTFSEGGTVTLTAVTLDDDDVATGSTTLFYGRITSVDKAFRSDSDGIAYTAHNGWDDMRKVTMTQSVMSWNVGDEALESVEVSRVVLGLDSNGVAQQTGATVTDIINAANAAGANVTAGAISGSLSVPPTEVVDTNCFSAFQDFRRYHPDYAAWIDGQTFNFQPVSGLSSITVDPDSGGLAVRNKPSGQAIASGVAITYETTNEIDGETRVSRTIDSAGSLSSWPPPIRTTIALAGTSISTLRAKIETRTIPDADDLTTTAAKAFYKGLFPVLSGADDADIAITSQTLVFVDPRVDELNEDGDDVVNPNAKPVDRGDVVVEDFPRMLIRGQVEQWMDGSPQQFEALLTATVYYRGTDEAIADYVGSGLSINETITITDALPKTYRETENITLGETPIEGLALSYWNAIKTPFNEGAVSGHLQGQFLGLRPGRKVAVSGEFSTAERITSFELDIVNQTFVSSYGPSEFLNPQSSAELGRLTQRNRPSWQRPEERTEAAAATGQKPVESNASPLQRFGGNSQGSGRDPWALQVVDAAAGTVRIEHGSITNGESITNRLTTTTENTIFTVDVGGYIVIKIDEEDPTDYAVEYHDSWPIADDWLVSKTTISEGVYEFGYRLYPLWKFSATREPFSTPINAGLFGIRQGEKANFKLFGTETDFAGGVRLMAPDLQPSYYVPG